MTLLLILVASSNCFKKRYFDFISNSHQSLVPCYHLAGQGKGKTYVIGMHMDVTVERAAQCTVAT